VIRSYNNRPGRWNVLVTIKPDPMKNLEIDEWYPFEKSKFNA
jgi:hypothetical protein